MVRRLSVLLIVLLTCLFSLENSVCAQSTVPFLAPEGLSAKSQAALGGCVAIDSGVLDPAKNPVVVLPLPKTLSEQTIALLKAYQSKGGKLVLVLTEVSPDSTVLAFLKEQGFPEAQIQYASKTLPLSWSGTPPVLSAGPIQEFLPVGTLMLKLASHEGALAAWGSDPAMIKTPSTVLLNWPWGQVLTSLGNQRLLYVAEHWMLPPPVVAKSKSAAVVASTAPKTAKPAARTNDQDVINAILGSPKSPNETVSQPAPPINPELEKYQSRLKELDTMKQKAKQALDGAIQLQLDVSLKTVEEDLVKADMARTDFEAAWLVGNSAKAEDSFRQAYQQLLDAYSLTLPSSKVESRSIWLDRGAIVQAGSEAGLRRLIARLDQAGINVLFFETLNAGFPIYPSKLLPQNPLIHGWDPLAVALDEAHKRGMELHAWVWVFAVGNTRHNTLIDKNRDYPGPILALHPELMSQTLHDHFGNLVLPRQHEYWLSPASPPARAFLKSVYTEIVQTYPVDGLQLDYIRYPFQPGGNMLTIEPFAKDRFKAETGFDLDKPDGTTSKAWTAWKAIQVSSFVKDLSDSLRKIRPNLVLSAAVFPIARNERLLAIQQDWESWIEKGWVELLSPMSYTVSAEHLGHIIQYVHSVSADRSLIYPGIAIDRLKPTQLLEQVDMARESGSLGTTMFASTYLDDEKSRALQQGPYHIKSTWIPHHDPLRASSALVAEYQELLQHLLARQTATVLSPQSLVGLKSALDTLNQSLTQNVNILTLERQSQAVVKATDTLLSELPATQEYRKHILRGYAAKIDNLIHYAAYHLPTVSSVVAKQ